MSQYAEYLERWPGYNEQSWPERFAELDRRYSVLLSQRDMAVEALRVFMGGEVDVSGTALIYEDLAHVAMLGEAALAQLEASKGEG